MRQIVILGYPGVDELDLAGVFVPLAKASETVTPAPGFATMVASSGAIKGSHGLLIEGHLNYESAATPALAGLVIPGGPGAVAAARDPRIAQLVIWAVGQRMQIYSICSGASILGELGLLRGRRVGLHTGKAAQAEITYGCNAQRGLVRDGWLVSVGGAPDRLGLKAMEIAFAILHDIAPQMIQVVSSRLETGPRWHDDIALAKEVE